MKFTIYGHHQCPWCDKALELLTDKGLPYTYKNVRTNPEAREFIVSQGFKTVPQVFLQVEPDADPEYIGGFDSLAEYIKQKDF